MFTSANSYNGVNEIKSFFRNTFEVVSGVELKKAGPGPYRAYLNLFRLLVGDANSTLSFEDFEAAASF